MPARPPAIRPDAKAKLSRSTCRLTCIDALRRRRIGAADVWKTLASSFLAFRCHVAFAVAWARARYKSDGKTRRLRKIGGQAGDSHRRRCRRKERRCRRRHDGSQSAAAAAIPGRGVALRLFKLLDAGRRLRVDFLGVRLALIIGILMAPRSAGLSCAGPATGPPRLGSVARLGRPPVRLTGKRRRWCGGLKCVLQAHG